MRTKVKKILKITLCGIGLAALFILCGIVGMRVERSNQRAMEMQKVHVDSIAVVNMDNGVLVGEKHVNYASQLMSFPSEHFIVTGLTDAKAGIENGSYAAYIVVPETFSASVTSIESDPQKVTLSCQYNTKLDEESRTHAMSDVNAFIALLNSNTAYMYLDAILAEFHRIQDDSSTILANDNTELELLVSVNADQLIAAAEPVDEIIVEDNIQPVQLETYTTQNHVLLDSMMADYTEAVQKGKDDYAAIQANNSEVGQAADNFFSTYDSVIQDTEAENAALLAVGREKLDDAVGVYNMNVDAQGDTVKNTIVSLIDLQLASDQAAVDYQLNDIVNDMKNRSREKLNALQHQWEQVYKSLQSKANASLTQKLDSCEGNLEKLARDIYIQGYENGYKSGCGNTLTDLNEKLESIKDEVDADSAAIIDKVQDIIDQIQSNDVPQSDIEDHIEGFNESIENQLGNIVIKWDQLGVVLPPIYGSSTDETSLDDGDNTGDETDPGDGDNTGGETDPGGGDNTGGETDPGDGDNTGGETDPGDGDNTGGETDSGDGDNTGGETDPGDGDNTGGETDPGDGDNTGGETDPGDGDNTGGETDPGDDIEYKISLAVFDGYEETISEAVTNTLQLFKLEPQLEEISNIIQTCFVDALSEESQRQMSRLTDAGQQLNQSMESYESRLMSYDPMQYIENANLNTYLSGIESNTGEMMSTVEQNNTDYMLYASEMYSTTTEHTTELRSSLDEANTQTTVNVEDCINNLITSRQTVNNINVDMLKGFTELLGYTRVESQGNTEVYDHIVSPVTSQVKGQTFVDTEIVVSEKEISAKVWIVLLLSVGIFLCLMEILNGIWRHHRKRNEENRESL